MSVANDLKICNGLMMVRQKDLEADGHQEPAPEPSEWKYKDFEDDDLLASMADMCLPLVVDSDLDPDNPSHSYEFNEIDGTSERAEIACSCTQIATFYGKERNHLYLKSFLQGKYVTPSNKQLYLEDIMSAKINIYFHVIQPRKCKSGMAVLLNFTDTDSFFTCTKQGEEMTLKVMQYDTNKLQHISSADIEKWSLLFFMSETMCGLYSFESALHSGWFIHTVDSGVKMQKEKRPGSVFELINSGT